MSTTTNISSRYNMTAEEHRKLGEEIHYLETVRKDEVAENLRVARSFGDLSENSEYDDAKTEQGKLNSEILDKKDLFENAVIIEVSQDLDVVGIGKRVSLKNSSTGAESQYEIVSSQSVDPFRKRISDSSPLGKALVSRRLGETFEFEAPGGRIVYEILKIEMVEDNAGTNRSR